jgi:hypothetical protein
MRNIKNRFPAKSHTSEKIEREAMKNGLGSTTINCPLFTKRSRYSYSYYSSLPICPYELIEKWRSDYLLHEAAKSTLHHF